MATCERGLDLDKGGLLGEDSGGSLEKKMGLLLCQPALRKEVLLQTHQIDLGLVGL